MRMFLGEKRKISGSSKVLTARQTAMAAVYLNDITLQFGWVLFKTGPTKVHIITFSIC